MSAAKKRKVDSECRAFQKKNLFSFSDEGLPLVASNTFDDSKPDCLKSVC